MSRPYKWTIEIEVDPVWVADGFEATDDWVCMMMQNMLGYATGEEVKGRVLKRPSLARIMREQGYSEERIAQAVAAGLTETP